MSAKMDLSPGRGGEQVAGLDPVKRGGKREARSPRLRRDRGKAPAGMRVKLSRIARALKARLRKAQGGRARRSVLWNPGIWKRLEVEP